MSCARYGNGHINETYLLVTDRQKYILQKINRHVFRDIPSLMQNIALVTRHLSRMESDPRRVLRLVPTVAGPDYWVDDGGESWRVYDFITGSVCLEKVGQAEDMLNVGIAFGKFQSMLADFPAHTLLETIHRFHDTQNRYAQLKSAMDADAAGRLRSVQAEVDFALERESEAGTMVRMLDVGALPLRVTHNDTKRILRRFSAFQDKTRKRRVFLPKAPFSVLTFSVILKAHSFVC